MATRFGFAQQDGGARWKRTPTCLIYWSWRSHGKKEHRARDLFYALWITDLPMRRVKENGEWTLFCPNEVLDKETGTGLMDVCGKEFEKGTPKWKPKVMDARHWKRSRCGSALLNPRWRLELRTCCTKNLQIVSRINRISALPRSLPA